MEYNFQIINNKQVYDGFHKINIYDFKHDLFAGGESGIITRELSHRKSCVALLPYDPGRNELVLIEQIRLGPIANNEHPWLLEIIAGMIEPGDTSESTIIRESKEEANLTISKLIPIYNYYSTPGGSSEKVTLYCGITDTSNAGGIHGLDDEHEDIKVHVLKVPEAFDMLNQGKINNASSIIALQWLKLNIHNI